MENPLDEFESMWRFPRLKPTKPIPDETTILKFRRLLEKQTPGRMLREKVNEFLADQSLMLKAGNVVDLSIISALNSTEIKKRA